MFTTLKHFICWLSSIPDQSMSNSSGTKFILNVSYNFKIQLSLDKTINDNDNDNDSDNDSDNDNEKHFIEHNIYYYKPCNYSKKYFI